jgi:glycosyltransferase involved in cell wall biosynthesis
MKIAFITLGYVPFRTSGLDVSGDRLVRGLLDKGHHVTVIAGAHQPLAETQTHPALEIHRVPPGRADWIGFAWRAARRLKKLERTARFDVVHFWDVHFAYAYSGQYVASLQQSFRQRWNTWDRETTSRLSQAYRLAYYSLGRSLAEIPSLNRAQGLLAGSAATRDEFIAHYGISSDRIALARHGIDTDFFRPVPNEARALRARLGLDENEPVILFAGFVTPRKGLDYLARALPLIRPSPRLIIVGRWNQKTRTRFMQLLGPCSDQVIEAGFVPDEQMPAYFSLANVYVSASLLEGFGLPLAESLACETPAVAADSGATAEVVGPGGILVPPHNSNALADAVSQLLRDPFHCRHLGMQGRAYVKNHFSVQEMVASVLAAYKRFT